MLPAGLFRFRNRRTELPAGRRCGSIGAGSETNGTEASLMSRSLIVIIVLLAAASAARGQTPPPGPVPEDGDTRYSYHRSEDGFVRLDQRTGEVSYCARRPSGWSCLVTPDDRAAFEAEIGRLQAENAALKKALLERGLPLPPGAKPDTSIGQAPQSKSPSEAEADRVLTLFERIWRRLVELMASLQRDLNKT